MLTQSANKYLNMEKKYDFVFIIRQCTMFHSSADDCICYTALGSCFSMMAGSIATLQYVTLRYATLRYATLRYATLRYATLRYATLTYDTLRYATLR